MSRAYQTTLTAANLFSYRPKTVRAVLIGLALSLFRFFPLSAQTANASWLTGPPADKFWSQLEQSPYVQNGQHGLTVYMLSYSTCGNCIVFLRDFWEPRKAKLQMREIFVHANQPRLLDEAADVALTRDPQIADAYYHRARTAPPSSSSADRVAALNRVEEFSTQANAFFQKIGHVQDSYPTFVFRSQDGKGPDKLWIVSGFGPQLAAQLDALLAQLK